MIETKGGRLGLITELVSYGLLDGILIVGGDPL